jgi:hypothetical protein
MEPSQKSGKVYDYITSPERLRKIDAKIQLKSKLDEMQQNEEDYHQRKWKERKNAIRTWFDMDMDDQMKIDEIMQEEPEIGDDIE